MSGARVFLDTHVPLYLLSGDAAKADRAEGLIAAGGVISVQVLNEFAAVALRKFGLSQAEVREVLGTLRAVCAIEPLTVQVHDLALDLSERYGFSFYDCAILASALQAGCGAVYTEDLQDGQVIEGRLLVRNPFSSDAGLQSL